MIMFVATDSQLDLLETIIAEHLHGLHARIVRLGGGVQATSNVNDFVVHISIKVSMAVITTTYLQMKITNFN